MIFLGISRVSSIFVVSHFSVLKSWFLTAVSRLDCRHFGKCQSTHQITGKNHGLIQFHLHNSLHRLLCLNSFENLNTVLKYFLICSILFWFFWFLSCVKLLIMGERAGESYAYALRRLIVSWFWLRRLSKRENLKIENNLEISKINWIGKIRRMCILTQLKTRMSILNH